jgi:hypothetical protein
MRGVATFARSLAVGTGVSVSRCRGQNWAAVDASSRQHGGVPDLVWDEVKGWFDPEVNGVLPDVHVPGTTVEDWRAVVDLIRSKGWAYEYSVDGRVSRIPGHAGNMLRPRDEAGVALKVWPTPGVLAIFRPYCVEQIDFDVDLRELQGQDRLDVLCALMRAIGRRLGKPVVMTPEGTDDVPVLGYDTDADRVVMLAQR